MEATDAVTHKRTPAHPSSPTSNCLFLPRMSAEHASVTVRVKEAAEAGVEYVKNSAEEAKASTAAALDHAKSSTAAAVEHVRESTAAAVGSATHAAEVSWEATKSAVAAVPALVRSEVAAAQQYVEVKRACEEAGCDHDTAAACAQVAADAKRK